MNKINKNYLIFTIILLIFFGFLFFAISRLTFLIVKNRDNFIEEKKDIGYIILKSEELEKIENYEKIEEKIDNAHELFANPQKPIEDVLFLKEIADNNNLNVKVDLGQKEKLGNDNWPHLNFRINLFGVFPDFLNFLEEIENRNRILEINDLKIEKATERIALSEGYQFTGNEINANILIKFYFLE